jgi:hypothetical protein
MGGWVGVRAWGWADVQQVGSQLHEVPQLSICQFIAILFFFQSP